MTKSILSLSTLLLALTTHAAQIDLSVGQTKTLGSCGGTITANDSTQGSGEQLNFVFRDVKNCSNFDIVKANGEFIGDYKAKKLQNQNGGRGGSFTLPKNLIEIGSNSVKISLKSNSGVHSDTITVRFNAYYPSPNPGYPNPNPSYPSPRSPLELTVGYTSYLPSCGGTISATESDLNFWGIGEQVNLVFKNITQCSNFDIVGANGMILPNYTAKKLQSSKDGVRFGSFTIPKSMIGFGFNRITVVMKSNSGIHSDVISVNFLALPW